jgi:glycosyltransferase involved in cell wall biosynthesis
VVRIPIPIDARVAAPLDRAHFGLPDDRFLFIFAFDFSSYFERKNPLAAIEAFGKAFQRGEDATLLIKSSGGQRFPEQWQRMKEAAAHLDVRFIDDYLEKNELRNLTRLCDCYVSLHRSEGYGLTIAEAMGFGRPVIATRYSANLDFTTADNSLLVSHQLVEIDADVGPYSRGQLWAEPDVDEAALHMQRVYADADLVARLGRRAQEHIATELSAAAVGRKVRARLEALR